MKKKLVMLLLATLTACTMAACSDISNLTQAAENAGGLISTLAEATSQEAAGKEADGKEAPGKEADSAGYTEASGSLSSASALDTSDLFTDRDLKQVADTSDAEYVTLKSGETYTITSEGVYVFSGNVTESQIYVEANDEDKVQIVLDGLTVSNTSSPCIYVKSADKVFVTTMSGTTSKLSVSGTFTADGDTNTDAVIFSKDDLVLNGEGTLAISSTDNAVSCKDTLKITGGTYEVSCTSDAFEAHDAIEISDGVINVSSCNDGLHAEDDEDDTTGYVYISGGTLTINASDDAIHATTVVQIDGGNLTLTGGECIEGTYVQINNGNINITASDDGINAAAKSGAYSPVFELNGGNVVIVMGAGDTDGVDSNGDIYINGGTIDITGQSTFDYDGKAEYNGGTIIENGTETNSISNQMMGGPGMGGMNRGGFQGQEGGQMPGDFRGGRPGQSEDGTSQMQMPDGSAPDGMSGMPGEMPNGEMGVLNGQRGGRPDENGEFQGPGRDGGPRGNKSNNQSNTF